MRKVINTERVEGRVYEHQLKIKTVQNQKSENFGKEFISGTLDVATDDAGLNIIQVHFTYVTPTTKNGGNNSTYQSLKKIIDEGKVWVVDGPEAATKVRIDTALALNDFYNQKDELVSAKTNEGGFVNIVTELGPENERNTFTTDMLITKVTHVEADPEKNVEKDYVVLHGAVFNFKNAILPVDFIVRNEAGMGYFESLEVSPSEPTFTKVWGRINSTSVTIEKTEESAFGEAAVKTYERKTREWVVTGTAKVPYDYGDETVLTEEEVIKASQDRETYLAERKKNRDEYNASRVAKQASAFAGSMNAPTPQAPIPAGGFNF